MLECALCKQWVNSSTTCLCQCRTSAHWAADVRRNGSGNCTIQRWASFLVTSHVTPL